MSIKLQRIKPTFRAAFAFALAAILPAIIFSIFRSAGAYLAMALLFCAGFAIAYYGLGKAFLSKKMSALTESPYADGVPTKRSVASRDGNLRLDVELLADRSLALTFSVCSLAAYGFTHRGGLLDVIKFSVRGMRVSPVTSPSKGVLCVRIKLPAGPHQKTMLERLHTLVIAGD